MGTVGVRSSQGVEVIRTHSLHASLQSVGGIKMLLPLFDQLDLPLEGEGVGAAEDLW